MYLPSLDNVHFAVLLYTCGAFAAYMIWPKSSTHGFVRGAIASLPQVNWIVFSLLSFLAVSAILVLAALGFLRFMDVENLSQASSYLFLNLFVSMMTPLVLILLITKRFSLLAIGALCFVVLIYLLFGFRYRLVILGVGLTISIAVIFSVKIRTVYVLGVVVIAMVLSNAIEMTRTYGAGLTLERLEGVGFGDLLFMRTYEIGPVFALVHVLEAQYEQIHFFPWYVGFTRLIPTFIWADKPYPFYLIYYPGGITEGLRNTAGVAATQHAEMFLQFGWWGIPILSFLYFSIVLYLGRRLAKLIYPLNLVGLALVPGFFGFYMQQRGGYFFQWFSEAIFTFGPIFLLAIASKLRHRGLHGKRNTFQ